MKTEEYVRHTLLMRRFHLLHFALLACALHNHADSH